MKKVKVLMDFTSVERSNKSRIGSYKSGRNIGKPHDHGSGFRIKEYNICKLYANYEKVD